MKKIFLFFAFLFSFSFVTNAQNTETNNEDAYFIRKIYDKALTESSAYPWLTYLTTKVGARLSGTPQAAAAVEFTRQMLDSLGVDSVWLQPCMVPHWERGEKEQVRIVNSQILGSLDLNALALGGSVGTGANGIVGEVIEVHSLDEVDKLGAEKIKGKIIFFNRAFDNTQIKTFSAYGGAVDQRGNGPERAKKYGAIGVLVRSMASGLNDVPHTGGTKGENGTPAVAISTNDAEKLSRLIKQEGSVKVYIRTTCRMLKKEKSYNVIGELRGSSSKEIIAVGGHLDSWDVGQGAHDDGAGCVQSMSVLQLMKQMNYRPKRTIRCVLFMNEENGLAGGTAYADEANRKKETHLAAMESDSGGFTPRGFGFEAQDNLFINYFKKVNAWSSLLEPYGLSLKKGHGGADIGPLKKQNCLLIGLEPDSQRYFDYHHTHNDRIEAVNKRELELGAAAMASMIYLLDKYGL